LRPQQAVLLIRGVLKGEPANVLAAELGLDYLSMLQLRRAIQENAKKLQSERPLPDFAAESDELFQTMTESPANTAQPPASGLAGLMFSASDVSGQPDTPLPDQAIVAIPEAEAPVSRSQQPTTAEQSQKHNWRATQSGVTVATPRKIQPGAAAGLYCMCWRGEHLRAGQLPTAHAWLWAGFHPAGWDKKGGYLQRFWRNLAGRALIL
jgi:hypothetical protein